MLDLAREHALVHALLPAEKRLVKLLGKAVAGKGGSNQLVLFDLLNAFPEYDHTTCAAHPDIVRLGATLPTIARRLRQFILKCLQQMRADRTLHGRLALLLTEVEFSFQHRQPQVALKAARQGQKLAETYGKYESALSFLDWQRRIVMTIVRTDLLSKIEALQGQARSLLHNLERLQTLRIFQELLISHRRQSLAPRSKYVRETLEGIASHPYMQATTPFPDLLTETLTQDVQGMYLLATQNGAIALELYTRLLERWQTEPDWVQVYPELYLDIFKNYQLATFWGTADNGKIQSYLHLIPNLDELPPKNRLDFQRIQHGHLMTLGLNTGKFQLVLAQIPWIKEWLQDNVDQLSGATQIAFYYNICITYFLNGDFAAAYHHLQPILRHANRKEREDIRDFSRVLQAILLYQLGDHDLTEYLSRSARQFFKRSPKQWAFEEAVLQFLGHAVSLSDPAPLKTATEKLAAQLKVFAEESAYPSPLLGLVEVQCWLQSRLEDKTITQAFMEMLARGA